MRITKKLIERCSMALIMALPVAYLFTTQIFALAGAHGEEVLAEMPYQEEWIETNDFQTGDDFKFVFNEEITLPDVTRSDYFDLKVDENASTYEYKGIRLDGSNEPPFLGYLYYSNATSAITVYTPTRRGWLQYPNWATIYFSNTSLMPDYYLQFGILYYKNPVQNTNYRDSLFNNMFGQSNFLTDWGEDVLSESPHGFAPFASMIKYLDSNMLHLGEKNYGLMAYGQLYYMLNVSIFFLIYKTMVFIPNIIARAFEWFRKENNEND